MKALIDYPPSMNVSEPRQSSQRLLLGKVYWLLLMSAPKNLILFVKFTYSCLHLKTVFCLNYIEE